jgi:hypothetical protein
MTDQQINWAITEAIGADPHWKCAKDYCNDLNAMHEAEHTLTSAQLLDYIAFLFDATYEATVATARQRAEAFLRTLGKWEATTEKSSADQKEVQG